MASAVSAFYPGLHDPAKCHTVSALHSGNRVLGSSAQSLSGPSAFSTDLVPVKFSRGLLVNCHLQRPGMSSFKGRTRRRGHLALKQGDTQPCIKQPFGQSHFYGDGVGEDRLKSRQNIHIRNSVVCRAESSGAGGFIEALKPRKKAETDFLQPAVRDNAMRAVEELGGRVTVGDVAARAGLKVSEAENALRALASDTNGYLEVSDEGDVLYVLPRGFRNVLLQKSVQLQLEPVLKSLEGVGEYLARVTFGSALLASIAITYAAIAVILTSARSEDNNRSSRDSYYSSQRSFGPAIYIDPTNLFWYWDPFYYRRVRTRREGGLTFFEAVFSFVFGDGDPNEGIEEQRWKLVGDYIAKRGGVVTAEELAPFLDPPAVEFLGNTSADEAYIIPVLQRFDGHPEVDEEGQILYRFPSLQRTGTDWLGRKRVQLEPEIQDGSFFAENKWTFSQSEGGQRVLTVALGAFNLAGVVVLGSLLRDPSVVRQLESGLVSFAAQAMPFLQAYAASFFAIPAIRWWLLQRRNAEVEQRNRIREQWASYVMKQVPEFVKKKTSARRLAESTVIGTDRVIYSTNKDVSEQDLEGQDWERRLKERESTSTPRS